jgi:hypothetical protein
VILRGRFRYQTLPARPEGHKRLCGVHPKRYWSISATAQQKPFTDTELDRDIAPVSPPPFGMVSAARATHCKGTVLYPPHPPNCKCLRLQGLHPLSFKGY